MGDHIWTSGSYMVDHIWTFHEGVIIYDWSYVGDHIWTIKILIYGPPVYEDHIWLSLIIIYGPHMTHIREGSKIRNSRIWYSYMTITVYDTHIWTSKHMRCSWAWDFHSKRWYFIVTACICSWFFTVGLRTCFAFGLSFVSRRSFDG